MKPQNISALCLAAVLSLLTASCATTSATPKKYSGASPLEWSQRLVASQIARHQFTPKWDYTVGLFSLSLLKLNEQKLWTQGFDATSGFIGIQAEDKRMELRSVRVRELP